MESRPPGRGRGRGKFSKPATPPPAEEEATPVQVADVDLDRLHVSTPPPVAPPSSTTSTVSPERPAGGLGRGRGRFLAAVGRGRGIGASAPVARRPPTPEEAHSDPSSDHERFEDSSEEEGMKTPPAEEHVITSSPEAPASPVAVGEDGRALHESPPVVETVRVGTIELASTPKEVVQPEEEPEPDPVIRKGDKGATVNLKTNYLRLRRIPDSPGMVEYHVSFISPDLPMESTEVRKRMLRSVAEEKGWRVRVFDGMVLVLPHKLSSEVTKVEGTHPEDVDAKLAKVTVVIVFIKIRQMKHCLHFYNNLMNRAMRAMNFVELRREFYDLHHIQYLNQHKIEVWPGKDLTVENQEDGLMVWVDSCSRVLQKETVYKYFDLIKNDPRRKEKFEEFVIGKQVLTRYNNRCYRIDHVQWDQTPASEFEWKDNQWISFVKYLKTQYQELKKETIEFAQPMLISKIKPRRNAKNQDPLIVALVPQLCFMTGLFEEQRNNFKVMTDLAAATRLSPLARMKSLQDFMTAMLSNDEVTQMFADWGLVLEPNLIEVKGRVMDGPELKFGERSILKKAGPDFSKDAGHSVFEPINIKKYVVICTPRDTKLAKTFIETYNQVCRPLNIKHLELGEVVPTKGMQPHNFVQAIAENGDPNKIQFVVIIMPSQRDDVYAAIKRQCVATRPIPSQCIVAKTLSNERRLRSVVLKVALQINCKLSGSLWALQMPLKNLVMFVGIDAAHDPKKKDASVICLIASLNNQCTKYFSRSHKNKVHEELSNSLKPMMKEALAKFRQVNGEFPSRIVVYRDGGSVGAVDVIMAQESDQIKEAVTEVCRGDVKDYTFVLVTKRIPQRFILEQRKEYANPTPGTVVDSVVTRRYLYDFYIVSQQVREGTVNPTHFIVLDKDDPIRPDLIQRMTYATCFMYYNWSGTVRVPAMVQYAHKLAALLIKHVKADPHRDICTTLYYL